MDVRPTSSMLVGGRRFYLPSADGNLFQLARTTLALERSKEKISELLHHLRKDMAQRPARVSAIFGRDPSTDSLKNMRSGTPLLTVDDLSYSGANPARARPVKRAEGLASGQVSAAPQFDSFASSAAS